MLFIIHVYEYPTVEWLLQLTNVTFTLDLQSENNYHKYTKNETLKRRTIPPNYATGIRESIDHCRVSNVERSQAVMINYWNQSTCRFQDYFYDESAPYTFEVITKPLHKSRKDSPNLIYECYSKYTYMNILYTGWDN